MDWTVHLKSRRLFSWWHPRKTRYLVYIWTWKLPYFSSDGHWVFKQVRHQKHSWTTDLLCGRRYVSERMLLCDSCGLFYRIFALCRKHLSDVSINWMAHQERFCYLWTPLCGKCGSNFKSMLFVLIAQNRILATHSKIALGWMPQNLTKEKAALVKAMAWCR